MFQDLLIPIIITSRPTQACLYPLYSGSLGPAHTHCTHIHVYSGLLISITLGITRAFPYPSHSHLQELRPAHTHYTKYYSGPFISNSHSVVYIFGLLCYLWIPISLRPAHLSHSLYTLGPPQAIHTNWMFCKQAHHALWDKVAIQAHTGSECPTHLANIASTEEAIEAFQQVKHTAVKKGIHPFKQRMIKNGAAAAVVPKGACTFLNMSKC